MTARQVLTIAAAAVIAVAASFMAGRCTAPKPELPVAKRDTLVRIDTVIREKLVYKDRIVLDSIRVTDTVLVRERRVYEDSTFRAVVSGIAPALESITFYQPQTIITDVRIIQAPPKAHAVSIGIDAAYCRQFSAPVFVEYEYRWKFARPHVRAGYDIAARGAYASAGVRFTFEY